MNLRPWKGAEYPQGKDTSAWRCEAVLGPSDGHSFGSVLDSSLSVALSSPEKFLAHL